jgi:hypothetical protein
MVKMHHCGNPVLRKQLGERRAIKEVGDHERSAHEMTVASGEIVVDDNPVSSSLERTAGVRANVACATCDENEGTVAHADCALAENTTVRQHASGSKIIQFLIAIPLMGILGLSGWLAFVRPDILPLASACAAKMVCSNVFIAERDADVVIRTDVQFREGSLVRFMKVDVDTTNRRVEAALLGLFVKRYAAYAEGRGCCTTGFKG